MNTPSDRPTNKQRRDEGGWADLPLAPLLIDELELGEGSLCGEDVDQHMASCRMAAHEIEALTRADALLHAGYSELVHRTQPVGEARVEGILRELREPGEFGLRRHTRRSLRMVLWVTFLLLSILGTYAFVKLALDAIP